MAALRGFVNLQRIRADVRWPIGCAALTDDDLIQRREMALEQLYDVANPDPAAAKLFMSEPTPRIERTSVGDRAVQYDLLPGAVGKTGAVTCVLGDIMRRSGSYRASVGDAWAACGAEVTTACKSLIFDRFMHEELFGRIESEVLVYSQLQPGLCTESRRLPVRDTVQYKGKAAGVLHTPEVPRYADMVRYVFDRLGWDANRFDVYRLRMEYPIMPSAVVVRNPLRPAEGEGVA